MEKTMDVGAFFVVVELKEEKLFLFCNTHNCKGRVKFSQLTMGKLWRRRSQLKKI